MRLKSRCFNFIIGIANYNGNRSIGECFGPICCWSVITKLTRLLSLGRVSFVLNDPHSNGFYLMITKLIVGWHGKNIIVDWTATRVPSDLLVSDRKKKLWVKWQLLIKSRRWQYDEMADGIAKLMWVSSPLIEFSEPVPIDGPTGGWRTEIERVVVTHVPISKYKNAHRLKNIYFHGLFLHFRRTKLSWLNLCLLSNYFSR